MNCKGLEFKDYISLIALVISIAGLIWTIYYNTKIKVSAQLSQFYQEQALDIYNNSSKKITISRFEIYKSKSRYSKEKKYAESWYNGHEAPKFLIDPQDSTTLTFKDQYSIEGFLMNRGKLNIYLELWIAGEKRRPMELK